MSIIFLDRLSSSLLLICPYRFNRFCLRNVDIWHTLASSCMLWFLTWSFLVLPLIHRSILISATCNLFSSFFLTAQHSAPYVTVGLITVLYTLEFLFIYMAPKRTNETFTCAALLSSLHRSRNLGSSIVAILNLSMCSYLDRRVSSEAWSVAIILLEYVSRKLCSSALRPRTHTITMLDVTIRSLWTLSVASSNGCRMSHNSEMSFISYTVGFAHCNL